MRALFDDFASIVENSWHKEIVGTPMFRVVQKLKKLKPQQLSHDPLNDMVCHAKRVSANELRVLIKARNSYLTQKAKESWVREGDANTSFFHSSIKKRRMRNRVYNVKDMDVNLCSTPEEIKTAFEKYYLKLLGTSNPVQPVSKKVIKTGKILTMIHQNILLKLVTDDEIKVAMFSIPGALPPGPDGFYSKFLKDSWSIVGKEVCTSVRNVFRTGKVLKELNATVLTLVPNTELPDNVLQIRPIACCNTGAFIKNRDIVDNILICQDLIKLYRRKLTHLCFADDLLMFSRGDLQSVTLLLRAFETFSIFSGLKTNNGKSNFYTNGISEAIVSSVEEASRMNRGGIPFRAFLWHGHEAKETPALVSWKQVCKPRRKGGMGLKNLHQWNVALIGKYVWWVEIKTDHLWVKWVHSIYIKQSTWSDYEPTLNTSWSWRRICAVQNQLKPWLFEDQWRQTNCEYTAQVGYNWLVDDGIDFTWYP
ncbi:uncharacterized protein LOC141618621 [Silene latifolia]|uniref:uncharacterized protein LOC141618621 n=1 Tax=Silene latifolia TaxID=37657 RepID=UPI003D76A5D8